MRALHEDMLTSSTYPNPLNVLRAHVAIERMPVDGLLGLLASRPIGGGVAGIERDRDVIITGSFCALTAVIDIICADSDVLKAQQGKDGSGSGGGGKDTVATLEMVHKQITALRPAEFQLEILENVFALLFMTTVRTRCTPPLYTPFPPDVAPFERTFSVV